MTQGDSIKNDRAVVPATCNLLPTRSNPILKGLTGTSSPLNGYWWPNMWGSLGEMFPNQIRGSRLAVAGPSGTQFRCVRLSRSTIWIVSIVT